MADAILVTQSNLDILLKGLKSRFLYRMSNTPFALAHTKISVLDVIQTAGAGTNILANDGTYKPMQTSTITDVTTKTNNAYSVLNIKPYNSTYIPDIPEYQNIVSKLSPIINTGDGTKVLNDAGVYVDVNLYRGLNSTEITDLCNQIKGGY